MPKGFHKTIKSRETKYVFHICNCGWECIVDDVKDERRALKLKAMKVRQHNKRCQDRGTDIDLGTRHPPMNGSYICGDLKPYLNNEGANVRDLISAQFKIDIAK